MIVIPAIDLREGACVQLVGGSYDAERVRVRDPVAALVAGILHEGLTTVDAIKEAMLDAGVPACVRSSCP